MRRFRLKTRVEPSPPPFATGNEIIPYIGVAGRVVRRYFYKCEYHYDVMFANEVVVRYRHENLRPLIDQGNTRA